MRRNCSFSLALGALVAACAAHNAPAALITSVTTEPLSRISDSAATYISTVAQGANYTTPDDLILGHWPIDNPRSMSSQHVRTFRDNAQTFTVDIAVFPLGIGATAVAIQFEKRANATDTFSFRLFKVASGNANATTLPEPASGDILVSGSGLALPTAASLGVTGTLSDDNNGASGTAILEFDEMVILQPGVYAIQFLPSWSSSTAYTTFDWVHTNSNPYAGGTRYERSSDGGVLGTSSNTFDRNFGIIGVAVPEPSTVVLFGVGALAFALLRRPS